MDEESLFAAALEKRATAERQAFLERECAGDDDLRRRVERLLAGDHFPNLDKSQKQCGGCGDLRRPHSQQTGEEHA